MMSFEQIRAAAHALDADERAQLALEILQSLDGSGIPSEQVAAAWNREARERLDRYDAGLEASISAEELHASLRPRLP